MEAVTDTVVMLIGNHLIMNQIALRRDMHDEKTVAEFCKKVEGIENLKMLYLLTYADLSAVGTDIWTNWKSALLWELYLKAYEYFSKGEEERISDMSLIDKKKGEILALIDKVFPKYRGGLYRADGVHCRQGWSLFKNRRDTYIKEYKYTRCPDIHKA